MKSPKNKRFSRVKKQLYLLLLFPLLILSYSLFFSEKNQAKPITKDTLEVESSLQRENVLEEFVPNEETEFFSKEEGKPLLWYAMINDSIVFYKNKGNHPITGKPLKLVTEEVINKYKASLKPEKKLAVVVKKRDYKVNEIKIIKKKKKPVVKKKVKRESIWNTKLYNTKEEDEVGLFVFNQNNKIDAPLMNRFKKEFRKKGYFVTDQIIYSSEITHEIATHLKSSNVEYFKGNLKKYADYICIASVTYAYKPNAYRNDLTDCTMRIIYFIYDASSAQKMFSETDKVIGSGQTKKTAKEAAIDKFIL
ncbi:hypothetical protein AAON49_00895 [Pseudotenacibaculum sp. MALMAid0570]|uniref:hypothetical protein n=1 Tax=Pseudotenacibaculum sp. MALMAid0570 TaxID=3143938 RepID=UPI0032DF99DE